jgi:hypothetical protein
MAFREIYQRQVALLVRVLPVIAEERELRSKAGRPSTSSSVTCLASRSTSI